MSVQLESLAMEPLVILKSVSDDDKSVHRIHFQAADASRDLADGTREVIQHFLRRCSIPFRKGDIDLEFYNLCCGDAVRRGCPLSGPHSIRPYIPGGVAMATTAYAHLSDPSTRLYIAMYTSFLIYLDDVFHNDVAVISEFNERFMLREPKGNVVLDAFSDLLQEMPARFGRLVSNIMITSTLNLVTALIIEDETQRMLLSPDAYQYPNFTRFMSGASETYALFVFPKDIPITAYFQSLPDLMTFINNGNDVLSFYKEELAGETVNRISLLAKCYSVTKDLVVQHLADEAVAAHARVLQMLKSYPDACKAYIHFSHGYVGFHAVLSRYRLGELSL